MNTISEILAQEMFEDFVSDVEKNDFTGFPYADTWDYEDEHSHNDIDNARSKFIKMANSYFNENHMGYIMREVADNAWVCNLDGGIIR